MTRPAILFVCLGNICRSPLAEAAFRAEAERQGLAVEVDSAGTGTYHLGYPPDRRAQRVAASAGIDISAHRARRVEAADFSRFSHIIALDTANLADLQSMRPAGATADLSLLLDHVPGREGSAVADPYYADDAAFDTTWSDVEAGARALVARLQREML